MSLTKMKKLYMLVGAFILALFIANVGHANTINFTFTSSTNASSLSTGIATVPRNSPSFFGFSYQVVGSGVNTRTFRVTPQRRNIGGTWTSGIASTHVANRSVRLFNRTLSSPGSQRQYRANFQFTTRGPQVRILGSLGR